MDRSNNSNLNNISNFNNDNLSMIHEENEIREQSEIDRLSPKKLKTSSIKMSCYIVQLTEQITIEQPDFKTSKVNTKFLLNKSHSVDIDHIPKGDLKTTYSNFEFIHNSKHIAFEKDKLEKILIEGFENSEIYEKSIKMDSTFIKTLPKVINNIKYDKLLSNNINITKDKELMSKLRENKILINLPTSFSQINNQNTSTIYQNVINKLLKKIETMKNEINELRVKNKSNNINNIDNTILNLKENEIEKTKRSVNNNKIKEQILEINLEIIGNKKSNDSSEIFSEIQVISDVGRKTFDKLNSRSFEKVIKNHSSKNSNSNKKNLKMQKNFNILNKHTSYEYNSNENSENKKSLEVKNMLNISSHLKSNKSSLDEKYHKEKASSKKLKELSTRILKHNTQNTTFKTKNKNNQKNNTNSYFNLSGKNYFTIVNSKHSSHVINELQVPVTLNKKISCSSGGINLLKNNFDYDEESFDNKIKNLEKQISQIKLDEDTNRKILERTLTDKFNDEVCKLKSLIKEKDYLLSNSQCNMEKCILKGSLKDGYRDFNRNQLNTELIKNNDIMSNFIDLKNHMINIFQNLRITLNDSEYLIDRRLITNILTQIFKKNLNLKIKNEMIEKLSKLLEMDEFEKKCIGIHKKNKSISENLIKSPVFNYLTMKPTQKSKEIQLPESMKHKTFVNKSNDFNNHHFEFDQHSEKKNQNLGWTSSVSSNSVNINSALNIVNEALNILYKY